MNHVNMYTRLYSYFKVNLVPSTTTATNTCIDDEDATFKCSDYVRYFDICNQITVTSKMIASTRCQKTC